nr:protein trapped in endoderm-1-like [Cherax quadricarinatus]
MNSSWEVRGLEDGGAPVGWIRAAQVWAWTVSVVGGTGNLVTVCTVVHQLHLGRLHHRGRYYQDGHYHQDGHHQDGHQQDGHLQDDRPSLRAQGDTLLLLHLSACDLVYCAINLPVTAITYNYAIAAAAPPSRLYCTAAAMFRYVNALAEWTTLGLLTVQRCVDLGRWPGARFFKPRPTILFIIGIWVGSVLLQLNAIIEVRRTSAKRSPTTVVLLTLESLLPCCLRLVGSLSIICQISRNTRMLRQAGMPKELVRRRYRRMLRSAGLLLALLLLFLVCVVPICLYNIVNLATDRDDVPIGIAIFMFYWIQYGVNFLVYGASNQAYRKAYAQFFRHMAGIGRGKLALRDGVGLGWAARGVVEGGLVAAKPINVDIGVGRPTGGGSRCLLGGGRYLGFHLVPNSTSSTESTSSRRSVGTLESGT